MNQTDFYTVATIAGMACVTVLTRCFFLFSSKPWTLPGWAQRGLHYAPIAALSAVIVPEMVMTQGQLIATWQDARIFAVLAGLACAKQARRTGTHHDHIKKFHGFRIIKY